MGLTKPYSMMGNTQGGYYNWADNLNFGGSNPRNLQTVIANSADPSAISLGDSYSMDTGFDTTSLNGVGNGSSLNNSWQKTWLGQGGLGSLALQGVNTGVNAYLGFKKLGMAKDQLAESKRQFNMNWNAQKKTVNNQLHNKHQSYRSGLSDPSKAQDTAAYMEKWGIK